MTWLWVIGATVGFGSLITYTIFVFKAGQESTEAKYAKAGMVSKEIYIESIKRTAVETDRLNQENMDLRKRLVSAPNDLGNVLSVLSEARNGRKKVPVTGKPGTT